MCRSLARPVHPTKLPPGPTALLVGPAATAMRLTKRMGAALVTAAVIGGGATWIGILLAYDSYYWGSAHHGYPVSFFIVAVRRGS